MAGPKAAALSARGCRHGTVGSTSREAESTYSKLGSDRLLGPYQVEPTPGADLSGRGGEDLFAATILGWIPLHLFLEVAGVLHRVGEAIPTIAIVAEHHSGPALRFFKWQTDHDVVMRCLKTEGLLVDDQRRLLAEGVDLSANLRDWCLRVGADPGLVIALIETRTGAYLPQDVADRITTWRQLIDACASYTLPRHPLRRALRLQVRVRLEPE